MDSEKKQKGQQVAQKGAFAVQSPESLIPPEVDWLQYVQMVRGDLQTLLDVVEKRDKDKTSPFNQKISKLQRMLDSVDESTTMSVYNEISESTRHLRDEISAQYRLAIPLTEDLQVAAALQQQLAGLNVGFQVVQQQGTRVNQNFLIEQLVRKGNENALESQEIREKMKKEAKEIEEIRNTIDEVDDKLKAKYEKLQKKYDLLVDKDTELKNSIRKLENENKDLHDELERKEKKMKKLEKQIIELEDENHALVEKLSKVRGDVRSLKDENQQLKEDVKDLSSQMASMEVTVNEINEKYKREKDIAVSSEKSRALILLGQAATNFVAKLYERVHPELFQSEVMYTMEDVENHCKSKKKYKKNPEKRDQAKARWDKIKQGLDDELPDWQETTRELKNQRNNVAHPDVEPDEALRSLKLLRDKYNMFSDDFDDIELLIGKWEHL